MQGLIEQHTGPLVSARQVTEGFNSEISVVINDSTFVKGLRTDHPRAWTQERERQINPYVRHVTAPLRWSRTEDGWDLNGFDFLDGRAASYKPSSPDLQPIAAMMIQWPTAPDGVELKQASQRWSAYSDRPELFDGAWLSHTDWSPGNVLITGDRAYMLDWAWPTRGARWIDPACWVVWLIAEGHHPAHAEARAARVQAFAAAPDLAVTAFARAQAAMWEDIAENAPHPALDSAATTWVGHRTA
ncbi:aminoglycoside phosphotransferase [Actinomadura spongiicola]|uniref:Aminoglycoside phosphotransferase n=1 Tax=Actinomadura spongiicola TaxID=2303421 RepID=A0A372G9Y9_9ACTN|nr:phosphotransferase [Actinomadura spongiicola]RFS82204.1 aminoglycoside phosphotransferase [Actinomadura spongiicola]